MSIVNGHDKPLSLDQRDRHVIERLRTATEPLSGELLSAELGVSRVALWKRIESLRAWGYGIEATRKGYRLVSDDGLAGWEIDAPGPVLLFDTVGSTMDEARILAADGAVCGTTVLALQQSAGRGLGGRPWVSPAGGLYVSVVLRSDLPPTSAGALSLEASSVALAALNAAGATSLRFRWPNDIVMTAASTGKSHKVGGVVVESYGDLGHAEYYIVGIGLSTAPLELAGSAAAARRAVLAAEMVKSLVRWAEYPILESSRWAWMAPEPGTVVRVSLWNGTERHLMPHGYNESGDLVPAGGGRPIAIGECRAVHFEGVSH